MGHYINETSKGLVGTSASEKAQAIIADGAKEIAEPETFIPNLVCILDNRMFGAAAHCYSESEFREFKKLSDGRPKRWFVWDKVQQYAR